MSRKHTRLNPLHPHNRLNSFLERMRAQYRQLPTKELDGLVNVMFAQMVAAERDPLEHPQHRHQKLEFLLARSEVQFKKEWFQRYGWHFDDCYDEAKLRTNVEAMKDPALKAEFPLKSQPVAVDTPPPVNLEVVHVPTGGYMSRQEYLALSEEDQKPIWANMNRIITRIIASGFAGVLPGANSMVVDRRLRPDAMPAQQSGVMGSPGPRKIEHECPDGVDLKEVVFSSWIRYEQNSYLKMWARVCLCDGTYDLEWRWPNADHFGPHDQRQVAWVQYCCEKDDVDAVMDIAKLDTVASIHIPKL